MEEAWGLCRKLFCSLAVLDRRVGHTMDVLSPFISVLCHSDSTGSSIRVLSTSWCCPSRPYVAFLTCVHLALFLALSLSPLFPHCVIIAWSLFAPALLRTHSFVFFAIQEARGIFLDPFISKASRRVSSFFLSVQLSQPYVATGHIARNAMNQTMIDNDDPRDHLNRK